MTTPAIETIGAYSDIKPIPGTGRLYIGTSPTVQQVVLKANREPEEKSDEAARFREERFAKFMLGHEKRIIDDLAHPHLCRFLDHFEHGGRSYLAMPLYGHQTWEDVDPRDISTIGRTVAQVSSALAYMHAEGLVHRDVKPSNIVLDQYGNATLIDFETSFSAGATPLEFWGTRKFMAPEQARGAPACRTGDVFGLSVSVYRLVSRALPYVPLEEETEENTVTASTSIPSESKKKQLDGDRIRPQYSIDKISSLGTLAELIILGLSIDPKQRPPMALIKEQAVAQFGLEARCS